MATTPEAKIAELLFARLKALTFSPVMPVAWPNLTFSPPADHRYLRAVFVPNVANRLLIDSDGPHQLLGLFQVSVYGKKNDGEIAVRDRAGAVAAFFPTDLRLGDASLSVRITKRPDVRDMLVEDADVQIPVMIAWEAFA